MWKAYGVTLLIGPGENTVYVCVYVCMYVPVCALYVYTSDMQGLFGASLSSQRHHAVCRPWMLSRGLAYSFPYFSQTRTTT